MIDRITMLKEIYHGLWSSADFECDVIMKFPSEYKILKWNENQVSDDDLILIYTFLNNHPAFN